MNNLSFDLSGFLLMFALGLRHGLDPDHITIIDGMTMKHNSEKSKWAKWVGTLFAIGHGLVVTVIAFLVSILSYTISFPIWLSNIAEWIPILLLLIIGILNLKSLLGKDEHQIIGWRKKLIPKSLVNNSNPFSIIMIGVLFATVFDTATQAAAWGYAASQQGGAIAAIVMGLIFSIGMIATDTIDGIILYKILNKTSDQTLIKKYRISIGWTIVAMSFLVAVYKTSSLLFPSTTLSEKTNSLIGISFLLFVVAIYLTIIYKRNKFQIN
jgi:high-affinity nickel-transport protein